MEKRQIEIIQKDGVIEIHRSGELEQSYDFNRKCSPVATANMVAEIIFDCLWCDCIPAELHDHNDTRSYIGSYFERLDQRIDVEEE